MYTHKQERCTHRQVSKKQTKQKLKYLCTVKYHKWDQTYGNLRKQQENLCKVKREKKKAVRMDKKPKFSTKFKCSL